MQQLLAVGCLSKTHALRCLKGFWICLYSDCIWKCFVSLYQTSNGIFQIPKWFKENLPCFEYFRKIILITCLEKARRSRDSLPLSLLIWYTTHAPWIRTSNIQTNENHHHFFIWVPILGHVLVHSVEKTHVLVVTVELISLFFLNNFFFKFVPIPNKSLRFTRFRSSYVNCTAVVRNNHCQSYRLRFFFLQLFVSNDSAFA